MSLWVFHLICSNGWFIQEWSKRLTLWMGLWIINGSHDSFKMRILSETKHRCVARRLTTVLLALQVIFLLAKLSKNTILCLKYNTILTSYLLNCCIKSHLHSCYSNISSTRAILLSLFVWYRLWYKYEL